MRSLKRPEITRELMKVFKGKKYNNISAMITQFQSGARAILPKWEDSLIKILECTREDLKKMWPDVRFPGEKIRKKVPEELLESMELEVSIKDPAVIKIKLGDFRELSQILEKLKQLGIDLELKVKI